MKNKHVLMCLNLIIMFLFTSGLFAQDNKFNVSLSGYVNWTAIFDSRQNVAAREGHLLLYPQNELIDVLGKDINDVNNFNMAVIQTRLGAKLTAPDFLGAKTSAFLESEFMGNSDTDVNGLRIRHAYVAFNWNNSTELLLGQTWFPMFITEAYPDQSGSNGGVPFQPFGRNPQIRLTQNFGNFRAIAALLTQRDFASSGPNGANNEYLRNAALPDFHLQLQYRNNKNLIGIGSEYKIIKPRIKTAKNFYQESTLASYALMGYTKVNFGNFSAAVEGVYGTNLSDLLMLGGYAVSKIDTATGLEEYTGVKTMSTWIDFNYKTFLEFGLFAGYSKNLGSEEKIAGAFYGRGGNIDKLYRLAPRVSYTEGKVKIAVEAELTSAFYGQSDAQGKVNNAKQLTNTRLLTSVFYFFN